MKLLNGDRVRRAFACVGVGVVGFWTLLLPACGGEDPCHAYCDTFVQRTGDCHLGGPSGQNFVDECAQDITLSAEQCDEADTKIAAMSCSDFTTLVCEQPSADQAYDCP